MKFRDYVGSTVTEKDISVDEFLDAVKEIAGISVFEAMEKKSSF